MNNRNLVALFILSVLVLIVVVSNPNYDSHKRVVAKKLNNKISFNSDFDNEYEFLGKMLGRSLGETFIEQYLNVTNYLIFSVGELEVEGKAINISVGYLGNVHILNSFLDKTKTEYSPNQKAQTLEKVYGDTDEIMAFREHRKKLSEENKSKEKILYETYPIRLTAIDNNNRDRIELFIYNIGEVKLKNIWVKLKLLSKSGINVYEKRLHFGHLSKGSMDSDEIYPNAEFDRINVELDKLNYYSTADRHKAYSDKAKDAVTKKVEKIKKSAVERLEKEVEKKLKKN